MTRKTPSLIGAAAGLALFLPIALLPSVLYGGYAGVLLAGAFGTPVSAGLGARVLIVCGMVVGVTLVAAVFAAAGAAAGAAIAALVRASTPELPAKPEVATAHPEPKK
jgi:hypothetical protein